LSNPTEHIASLKLLQDLCSISGEIPSSFYLKDVNVNRNEQIGKGGEALVYSGHFNGQSVAVRQVLPLRRNYWQSPDGQRTIKVNVS